MNMFTIIQASQFLIRELHRISEEFNITIRYEYDSISEIHLVEFPEDFADRIGTATKELFLAFFDKFPYQEVVFFPKGDVVLSISEQALEVGANAKRPKCYTCEHCVQWHSSVVTYRCGKIRGRRDSDTGDYEDEMKIGKLKLACQFYEYRGY